MKKIKIILIAILILFVLCGYCSAFSFEFNNNTYTIDYNIKEFEKVWVGDDGTITYLSYLLIYNCSSNNFYLLCFDEEIILVERTNERIRFLDSNNIGIRSFIYILSDNFWEFVGLKNRYDFPSTLDNQVILYKSDGITIDSSVYDIVGDGSVTLDFILKDTEITENGYKYEVIEEPINEITLKDIYNSLNILVFVVVVLLIYLFLKSILRIRG